MPEYDSPLIVNADPGEVPITIVGADTDNVGLSSEPIHGADVASAGTTDLDAVTGHLLDITGTTGITAITLGEGKQRVVRFTGALILTHGASLILPGSANITTVAGDIAFFVGYAAGVVRCASYSKFAVAPGAPTAHATSHQAGGADSIKLDDLAATDDNTDLDASITAHGLLKKLSNVATEVFNGVGAFIAFTLSMLPTQAQSTILGRAASAGTGVPSALTVTEIVTMVKGRTSISLAVGNEARLTHHKDVEVLATTNLNVADISANWPINGSAYPGSGYRVLLTAQTDKLENGLWLTEPGAGVGLSRGSNSGHTDIGAAGGLQNWDKFRVNPLGTSYYAGTYWHISSTSFPFVDVPISSGANQVDMTKIHPHPLPVFKTTLAYNMVIETDEQAVIYGTLTVTTGILIVNGSGLLIILRTPSGT